jgi:Fe-S cluster assembly ATP-binding protein
MAGHLEVRDLTLTCGDAQVLNGVTLDFAPGAVHAIVGPNGAGKSTLASAIMGLFGYRDGGGDILLDGASIRELSVDERARLGITLGFQEPARYEGLPVYEFVLAGAREKSLDVVGQALATVGLDPEKYMRRAVDRTLSGGERKRIELASILAMAPAIVLMDEPDSGIDVEALNRIFDAIARLKEAGSTVILITHSLTVLGHAEHAFLLCAGKIVDEGSAAEIARYFEESCTSCVFQNGREVAPAEGER